MASEIRPLGTGWRDRLLAWREWRGGNWNVVFRQKPFDLSNGIRARFVLPSLDLGSGHGRGRRQKRRRFDGHRSQNEEYKFRANWFAARPWSDDGLVIEPRQIQSKHRNGARFGGVPSGVNGSGMALPNALRISWKRSRAFSSVSPPSSYTTLGLAMPRLPGRCCGRRLHRAVLAQRHNASGSIYSSCRLCGLSLADWLGLIQRLAPHQNLGNHTPHGPIEP